MTTLKAPYPYFASLKRTHLCYNKGNLISETALGVPPPCAASNHNSHGRTEMAIADHTPCFDQLTIERFWAR